MPRRIRPLVPVTAPSTLSSGKWSVHAMTCPVACKAGARSTRAHGPAGSLVPAGAAAQEHPAAVHLQQGVVAAKAAHRDRQGPGGPGPPGSNHTERVGRSNNLRGLCEIRRHDFHDLRVLPRSYHYDAGPPVAFRGTSANPLSLQTSCHVTSDKANTVEDRDLQRFHRLRMSFQLCGKWNRIQGPGCRESGHKG